MARRFFVSFLILIFFTGCQTIRISRAQYASVYFNLANAYRELEKTDDALKAYYEALRVDPSLTRNSFNFSKLLIEKKRYDEALKLLIPMHDASPQNTMILEVLAYVYYLKGDYTEAASCYKTILTIDPRHENALFNSALLYEALDMPREAYERLIETLPFLEDTTDALKKIALLAYDIGEYEDALKYMNDYLAKKSDDTSIEWEYARILAKNKDFEKAAEIYDKLDTDANTNAELTFERAEVYLLGMESFEKGKEILARAIENGFWETDRLYALATAPDFLYGEEITAYLKEENLFFNPEKERLAAARAVERRRAAAEEAKKEAEAEEAGESAGASYEIGDDNVFYVDFNDQKGTVEDEPVVASGGNADALSVSESFIAIFDGGDEALVSVSYSGTVKPSSSGGLFNSVSDAESFGSLFGGFMREDPLSEDGLPIWSDSVSLESESSSVVLRLENLPAGTYEIGLLSVRNDTSVETDAVFDVTVGTVSGEPSAVGFTEDGGEAPDDAVLSETDKFTVSRSSGSEARGYAFIWTVEPEDGVAEITVSGTCALNAVRVEKTN